MPQEIILKVGDTVEYSQGRKGLIKRIRILSTGKCVEEYIYDGDGHDLVLTLRCNNSITNLWVKNTRIHKVPEEKKG
jgi:small-conductance mechanosensitive channel